MGLRWKGLTPKALGTLWTNAARNVRREARDTLREETETIKDLSVQMVPLDTGEAEKSHRVVEKQANQFRMGISIEVGGMVDGVNVDDYILFLHEGDYKLGPRSSQKQAGSSVKVGRKFLDRAYQERRDELIAAIRRNLEQFR